MFKYGAHDALQMYVDVPGIDHKALTIELYDNPAVLAISGMRSEVSAATSRVGALPASLREAHSAPVR